MASWFDSHCHLHLCEENAPVEDLVAHARSAGVQGLLTVGIDATSSRRSLELAQRFSIFASAGVHPNSAHEWNEDASAQVAGLLDDERVVAVGETGLDFYRDSCPPDLQRRAFADHIGLAQATGKTLVIHTRNSVDDALDLLTGTGPPERFIFHCWSGDAGQLNRALGLGAFVSFAGNVSFKNAEDLRAAARLVPLDRLLVETDSPFLAPVPYRGRANEPAHVVDVGRAVAEAIGAPEDDVAAATTANARRLFGTT
jgi:TatD DNase family protein